ncbi:chemotaxis protein CheB [Uliginosibacterium sp. H1]|uniref:chemotaxis protein CheB n=1 Tax=Uliginosibacterium sp. H1 TaxID=3114757 RepID=UPI002E19EA07|nr:chemotaxis protein CheB [Uliginosibacterium sp. H1]
MIRLGKRPARSGPAVDAIAIGASAGGVEALSTLLSALPADFDLPVFIVQHLPRERPSLLADIFTPRCRRPVYEAADKEPVARGTVYFAPPDYHLLIDRGDAGPLLSLSSDEPVCFARPSIDVLFEAAADVYAEGLLGIVLSGANDDGSDGLAAILAAGGRGWVQRPAEASSSLMPASALARSPAAEVLSLADMAARLGRSPFATTQRA